MSPSQATRTRVEAAPRGRPPAATPVRARMSAERVSRRRAPAPDTQRRAKLHTRPASYAENAPVPPSAVKAGLPTRQLSPPEPPRGRLLPLASSRAASRRAPSTARRSATPAVHAETHRQRHCLRRQQCQWSRHFAIRVGAPSCFPRIQRNGSQEAEAVSGREAAWHRGRVQQACSLERRGWRLVRAAVSVCAHLRVARVRRLQREPHLQRVGRQGVQRRV